MFISFYLELNLVSWLTIFSRQLRSEFGLWWRHSHLLVEQHQQTRQLDRFACEDAPLRKARFVTKRLESMGRAWGPPGNGETWWNMVKHGETWWNMVKLRQRWEWWDGVRITFWHGTTAPRQVSLGIPVMAMNSVQFKGWLKDVEFRCTVNHNQLMVNQ